jgi:Maf-like protein
MRIVLASESPFRKRALDMLELAYEVCPGRVDEKAIRDHNLGELTRKLAEEKAQVLFADYSAIIPPSFISVDMVLTREYQQLCAWLYRAPAPYRFHARASKSARRQPCQNLSEQFLRGITM